MKINQPPQFNQQSKFYGSIPDPKADDPHSIYKTLLAVKQAVEVLIRQRKPVEAGAVTWQDLLDLGLIDKNDMPRR